jgi:murein DD-endopeptidase
MFSIFQSLVQRSDRSTIQECFSFQRWQPVVLAFACALCSVFATNSAMSASNSEAVASSELAGTWAGALGPLHIVLTINRLTSGGYSAEINSVDQGSILPVDSMTVDNRTVSLDVKTVAGSYRGTANAAGDEINGTWTQKGAPTQPLVFKRTAASAPTAASDSGPTAKPIFVPLDVVTPIAPTLFSADHQFHLVYELHITNMGQWSTVLAGLEVTGEDPASPPVASFTQANLEGMIKPLGEKTSEKSRIAPGGSVVIYVWLSAERREDLPVALRHRLNVKLGTFPEALTIQTYPIAVAANSIIIGSPLQGDHWVAANGPSNTSVHRRALIPIQGKATIAQRFAIDWVRIDENGKTFHGDALDNRNYYAYGAEALAVADGVVTETLDGVAQNVPGVNSRAVPITVENIGGNHVVVDIGDGHYAFYAHLQPGSLKVKLGDRVRRGQVLGLVGNTGNSTEPHLHFHISNATSPLGAEGLPYALTSFEVQGHQATVTGKSGKVEQETLALPTEGEVIRFPVAP